MRGKPSTYSRLPLWSRITPADAGKTSRHALHRLRNQDHPRGCGENLPTIIIEIVKSGSPPRMRGKQVYPSAISPPRGITPADAGKTRSLSAILPRARDHPRGCGENECVRYAVKIHTGSPPRMRGKQNGKAKDRDRLRITPADAGKTCRLCF